MFVFLCRALDPHAPKKNVFVYNKPQQKKNIMAITGNAILIFIALSIQVVAILTPQWYVNHKNNGEVCGNLGLLLSPVQDATPLPWKTQSAQDWGVFITGVGYPATLILALILVLAGFSDKAVLVVLGIAVIMPLVGLIWDLFRGTKGSPKRRGYSYYLSWASTLIVLLIVGLIGLGRQPTLSFGSSMFSSLSNGVNGLNGARY